MENDREELNETENEVGRKSNPSQIPIERTKQSNVITDLWGENRNRGINHCRLGVKSDKKKRFYQVHILNK